MSEVVPVQPKPPLMAMGQRGIQLATFEDAWRFAVAVAKTKFAPKDWSPEDVVIALQYGMEVGLGPMQALQSIAVINGKPSMYGDAPLALVKQHPQYEGCREWREGKPYDDNFAAYCELRRKGEDNVTQYFSVGMAKKAGLWGKSGPWQTSPDRMLQFRARGFAIRDQFPDVMRGLITEAEARDIDPETGEAPEVRRYALASPERLERNRELERDMDEAFQTKEPAPAKRRGRPAKAATLPVREDMTAAGPSATVTVRESLEENSAEREPGDDTEDVQAERAQAAPPRTVDKPSLRERVLALKAKGLVINAWQGFNPNDLADMIRYEKLVDEAEARLEKGTA